MTMDHLSLAALDSAAIDYESTSSVCAELAEFLGETLSEERLFSAFCALESQGFVEAYRVDPNSQALVPTQPSANDLPSAIWFIASTEGRLLLEREWEPTFRLAGTKQ